MSDVTLKYLLFGEDRTASKTLRNLGGEADKAGSRLEGIGARLGGLGKATALAVGGAAVAGVAALTAATVGGVSAAAEYQTLSLKTEAVLKSTGNAANQSTKAILDRAAALETMSGVDEAMIINGQNVLATFTNVRDLAGEGNDIFNRATGAALDMSVALGQDMQSSVTQLGKALNDPIKGVVALSKVGVTFTQQQKDQIQALVKSGDTLGAQKVILSELNKEFGGTAEAAGKGFAGAMARAQDAVSDAFREVGTSLLPVLANLADWFVREGMPAIRGFAETALPILKAGWDAAVDVVQTKVIPVIRAVGQWFTDKIAPGIRAFAENILPGLRDAWASATKKIDEHRPQLEAIGNVLKTVVEFIWGTVIPIIGTILGHAFRAVGEAIGAVIGVISVLVDAFGVLGRWGIWLWNNALAPTVRFILTGFASLTGGVAAFLDALGSIPGFEWAQTAAAKLRAASDQAHGLAQGIREIDDKTVTVTIAGNWSAADAALARINAANKHAAMDRGRGFAAGGTNIPAGLAWVGEQGPELINVPGGSTIYDARTSAAMARGGSSASMASGGGESRPYLVQLVADGRVLQEILLGHKRSNGGTALGLA